MASIEQALIEDLTIELEISDPKFNPTLLTSKVNSVVKEVIRARKYPSNYTSEMIEADIAEYYSNCRALSLYDYNKVGIDGQSSHSESGVSASYTDRNRLFSGITPISRL